MLGMVCLNVLLDFFVQLIEKCCQYVNKICYKFSMNVYASSCTARYVLCLGNKLINFCVSVTRKYSTIMDNDISHEVYTFYGWKLRTKGC